MVYGAIDINNKKYYTFLAEVFATIEDKQQEFNWLITDYDGCAKDEKVDDRLSREYCWLSGEELTEMIEKDDFQWIWGILSGFRKDISLEKALEYELPDIEKATYWKNPVTIQHELASIEIIAFDSCCTVFKTKDKELYERFRSRSSESKDLREYNCQIYNYDFFFERILKEKCIGEMSFCFEDEKEKFLGIMKEYERPYWIGECDNKDGMDFESAKSLVDAKVYDGKSLRERWAEVEIISIDALSAEEWLEMCYFT